MVQRCSNKNNKAYHNYGGRGIAVCPEWLVFGGFLADMGEAPDGLTLDRKDPDLGYYKGNCHWADWVEQALNKRSRGTRLITFEGVTQSPQKWAEALAIPVQRIQVRRRKGWAIDRILSKDIFKGRNKNGQITRRK